MYNPSVLVPSRRLRWKFRRIAKQEVKRQHLEPGKPSPYINEMRTECEQQLRVVRHTHGDEMEGSLIRAKQHDLKMRTHVGDPSEIKNLIMTQGGLVAAILAAIDATEKNMEFLVKVQHTREEIYARELLHASDGMWEAPRPGKFETTLPVEREQIKKFSEYVDSLLKKMARGANPDQAKGH